MTPVNRIGISGDIGTGKTTTATNMLRYGMGLHSGQWGVALPSSAAGWQTGPGGFHLEQVSPLLKAGMDRMSQKLFPAKTLPDAVGEKGELARFRWRNEAWELHSLPGERLWTGENGIDVPELVAGLKRYRVVVLTFQAPLLSPELGTKYLLGLTEVYQLPQLGYGLADAAANAAELAFGLSRAGLLDRYPREVRALRAHDASQVAFNYKSGRFEVKAVHRGAAVAPHAVEQAFAAVVHGEHQRNLGRLLVRHALPFVNERVILGLTHTDIAAQFLPRIITETDWAAAFGYLWGGIDHTSAQSVLVPNVVMELQPKSGGPRRKPPAAPRPEGEAKACKKHTAATITALDPKGAERLWTSIHHLLASRRATEPVVDAEPTPRRRFVWPFGGKKTARNGTAQ